MNEGRDLLSEWLEAIRLQKWRVAKPLDEPYKRTDDTEAVLRKFFNPKDYVASKKEFDDDNYLVHLLTSDREQEIYLLNELAELVVYAKEHTPHIILKSKKGYIAHATLAGALFEVYIDKFLTNRGIHTIYGESYKDHKGNIKPLDNHFEFEGRKYLVECCRVDEPVNKSILQLSQFLMVSIIQDSIGRKGLPAYKAFRGHIGFKTEQALSSAIDAAKGKVWQLYKSYLHCFNVADLSIVLPQVYKSDEFDIEILPYYLTKSHEEKLDENGQAYRTLVSFETKTEHTDINRTSLIVTGKNLRDLDKINNNLFDKVKEKIDQHKYAPVDYHKLIFIEIETTKGHNPNNPMFSPIDRKNLDVKKFYSLINERISIVFVIKEAKNTGIKREMIFLSFPIHKPLAKFLKSNN